MLYGSECARIPRCLMLFFKFFPFLFVFTYIIMSEEVFQKGGGWMDGWMDENAEAEAEG